MSSWSVRERRARSTVRTPFVLLFIIAEHSEALNRVSGGSILGWRIRICASRSGMQYISPASCPRARASCPYACTLGLGRLVPDTKAVLAVQSSMARDGMSAGNDMDREPGTGDGKPGTRDGASGTTGYGKPSSRYGKPCTRDGASGTIGYVWHGTGDGKPGTRLGMGSLSLAPAIRVRLAPWMAGPGSVRLLATIWTVSLAPEMASLALGRDCAVQYMYVCTREATE